jgi:large subunit ribosomal protein L6
MQLEIEIPKGVKVERVGRELKVAGPKGELSRELFHPKIEIKIEEKKIILLSRGESKREKKMIGTLKAHIQNMIKGVTKGFVYKLKICFKHFPISVKVEGENFVIMNFLGEKIPRIAKILPGVEIDVKRNDVIVRGIDIEKVSQTAANIERATKIKRKDRRVFQDGIWIYQKDEKLLL